jgi:cell envelope opacity-associated protein A
LNRGNVYIDDFVSDRNSIITKIPDGIPTQVVTLENKIQTQIELILAKLIQKSPQKVTLSQLSQEFKVKHNKSISQLLQSNKLPKSTLSFIQKKCAEKIKVETNGKEHYLSLKSI